MSSLFSHTLDNIEEAEISDEEHDPNLDIEEGSENNENEEGDQDEFGGNEEEDGMYPPGIIVAPDPNPEDEINAGESNKVTPYR